MHNLYSSIQGCSWCSCPDVCCQLWCWRFLRDKAEEPVFHWGRKTQQDTVFHLLYLIPSGNRTLPSSPLKRKKKKILKKNEEKNVKCRVACLKWSSQRNFNDTFIKQPCGRTTYLPLNPVGRTSRVDTEIQFCCPWGLGLRRPSHRENQLRRIPKVPSNLRRHRTGRLDTLDTHLPTHSDSWVLIVLSRSGCQDLCVSLVYVYCLVTSCFILKPSSLMSCGSLCCTLCFVFCLCYCLF